MSDKSWVRTPITLGGIQDWFIRKWRTLAFAFCIAAIVWGVAVVMGYLFEPHSLPSSASVITYAQGQDYTLIKQGTGITLIRNRGTFIQIVLVVWCLFSSFFVIDSLWNYFKLSRSIWLRKKIEHSSRTRTTRFRSSLFLDILFPGLLLGFIGLIDYAYLVPAFEIVAFQHVVQFDPQHDMVFYNGQPLGKFSEIDEFFGIYKHLGQGSWGEWGVRLRDGRYLVLSSGPYDGDAKSLAIYMNQYLKSTPRSIPQM